MVLKLSFETTGLTGLTDDVIKTEDLPSNVYVGRILNAFITESEKEDDHSATLNLILDIGGNYPFKTSFKFLNDEGSNSYKKEGSDDLIPIKGFKNVNTIYQLATGKEFTATVPMRDGVADTFNSSTNKMEPTKVTELPELINKSLKFALIRRLSNKKKMYYEIDKDTQKQVMKFKDIAGEKTSLVFDGVFTLDGKTLQEKLENKEPTVITEWLAAKKGTINDTRTLTSGSASSDNSSKSADDIDF